MIIKHPEKEDIPGLRLLWQEAFGDSDSFLDGFFATGYSPDRCRMILADRRPVAALYWFDCRWQDQKLAYIYAVATDKAYRGRGLCSRLMEDTHRLLQRRGYGAAVLVPGSPGLFTLYEKLGYKTFCPMEMTVLSPEGAATAAKKITGPEYNRLRRQLLPEGGILQEGATTDYLAAFTDFYAGEDFLACVSREDRTLYFQEYLGDPEKAAALIKALDADAGHLRLPGGKDYAMYYSLGSIDLSGAYFGIALG